MKSQDSKTSISLLDRVTDQLPSSKYQPREQPSFEPDQPVSFEVLENTDISDQPYVHAQQELEILFDKNQRTKRIKSEFDIDLMREMTLQANMPHDFCVDLCAQMVMHRRAKPNVMIGILYHHFEAHDLSRQQAMQLCAEALESAIEHDFVDFDLCQGVFVQKLGLMPETIKELDRYQYPMPMMVQPRVCRSNRDNGYLSPNTSKSLVVLKGEKADGFYETADVCLDHLNRANSIALSINHDVVNLIDNEWADLDSKRTSETWEDYQRRVKAFERYDSVSRDVVQAISGLRDRFWLTHKYDRRGRVYCQGYHITYQGNPWNKACIEFADKDLVVI